MALTQRGVVDLLRELQGLEHLQQRIRQLPAPEPEWAYALLALRDRINWCRYCISLEDAVMVGAALDVLAAENQTAALKPQVRTDCQPAIASQLLPAPATIH